MAKGDIAYIAILEDLLRVIEIYVDSITDAWRSQDAKVILERTRKHLAGLWKQLRDEDEETAA